MLPGNRYRAKLAIHKIASDLHLLDSYAGLTLPLIASATATLLFRQFFMTVPKELVEASKIDGAGPLRFFKDTLLPLSLTNIAALFVILFIFTWLLISRQARLEKKLDELKQRLKEKS